MAQDQNHEHEDIGALTAMLDEDDWKVRGDACIMILKLAEQGETGVVDGLFGVMEKGINSFVQVDAARFVRDLAETHQLYDRLYTFTLAHAITIPGAECLRTLIALNEQRTVTQLLEALQSSDDAKRRAAAFLLGRLGNQRATEPLIAALHDKDAEVRMWAARGLYEVADERTVAPLLSLLDDPDGRVRSSAAQALATQKDRRAVAPLIALLTDEICGGPAANALGIIGDRRAAEPLIDALESRHVVTRMLAARALGQLGDERAVDPLIRALEDEHSAVREEAAFSLGSRKLQDPRAIEPLIRLLRGYDRVQYAAICSLGTLGGRRAVEAIRSVLKREDGTINDTAAKYLERLASSDAMEE